MRRLALIGSMMLALAGGSVCGDDGHGRVDYASAEFEFRTGPEVIVLAVHASANFSKSSVLLYGDGRVEIQENDRALERRVTIDEMREVLATAVAAGLAEWDDETIHARMLRDWGRPFALPADGVRVRVQLHLENYRRGPVEKDEVSQHIVMQSPSFAARHLPRIPQFAGLAAMGEWAYEQTQLAESEAEQ